MNKTIGFQLLVYSLLLVGLSCLVHHLAPSSSLPTLITGLVGGALCLVWSIKAIRGARSKALPILTLFLVNFMLFSQTVISWSRKSQEVPEYQFAAVAITLLLMLSLGMVVRIAWAGIVFDVPSANPTREERDKQERMRASPSANTP